MECSADFRNPKHGLITSPVRNLRIIRMPKRNVLWISLLCGFILLLSGLGGGYLLITRVYLPEEMNGDTDTQLLLRWEKEDPYLPPPDGIIRPEELNKFLQVNDSLAVYLKEIKKQFAENSWRIAFDVIKMQPRWAGIKYQALRQNHLSPKQYNWISDRVIDFWIYRWKEESLVKLREFGWEFGSDQPDQERPLNYDILAAHENELNQIFDILWPEKPYVQEEPTDSLLSRKP